MVHSTGANNPYLKRYVQPNIEGIGLNVNNNDWNRPDKEESVHAFIGLLNCGVPAVVQTLPYDARASHCGSGKRGSANNTHIAFEICEGDLNDRGYFNRVYPLAVEFTAERCIEFGLDPLEPGVVICHSEGNKLGIASGHADVMHWFPRHGKSMDSFRKDVLEKMKNIVKRLVQEELANADTVRAEAYNKPASWAATSLAKAKAKVGADGKAILDGTRPGAPVTRQEFAVVLDRLRLL